MGILAFNRGGEEVVWVVGLCVLGGGGGVIQIVSNRESLNFLLEECLLSRIATAMKMKATRMKKLITMKLTTAMV